MAKILLVKNELANSGVPAATFGLAKALKKAGHEPVIVSPQDGVLTKEYHKEGIAVQIIPNILEDADVGYQVAKQVDLVIVNTLVGFNVVYGAKGANKPCLFIVHEPEFGVRMAKGNPVIAKAFKLATEVVFPTKWSQSHYEEFLNKSSNLIYTGVDVDTTNVSDPFLGKKDPSKFYILQLGSVEYRKGQDVALNACEIVGNDAELLICGRILDQNFANQLAHYASEKKINVKFLGIQSDDVKRGLLAHCDALIMPSRDELIATAVTEAQAFGLPVLGCDSGATNEAVIDSKTGYLLPNEDYTGLSDKIKLLMSNKKLTKDLGENGKILYNEQRSYEAYSKAYVSLVERLLNEKTSTTN